MINFIHTLIQRHNGARKQKLLTIGCVFSYIYIGFVSIFHSFYGIYTICCLIGGTHLELDITVQYHCLASHQRVTEGAQQFLRSQQIVLHGHSNS